ncbi:hypothetical protein [Mesorhizobium sp. M1163]|uniref:hypothetical protein n=1 Tax=Mesorhizobium sp. M1163 TaxID=2957065 RepID=UPI00333955DF
MNALGIQTIYGTDGEYETPYMTRVWIGRLRLHIFHRGDADPDPHDHPWDFWTFPLTSYVEDFTLRILDSDRSHDALPMVALKMGWVTKRRLVRAFRIHHRRANYLHRVLGRFSGNWWHDWPGRLRGHPPLPCFDGRKIVTIVWVGRQSRKWGFLRYRDGNWCWTPWREYVFGGGKHAPCEPRDGGAQ